MSRASVALLLALNRFAPHLSTEVVTAKEDADRFSEWEYSRAADVTRAYRPEFDPRGRHVLDLGTGFGGKLIYYRQLGPASITTVDIRPDFSAAARAFVASVDRRGSLTGAQRAGSGDLRPSSSGIVRFVVADAAQLPFDDAVFDVVISNETFEHVRRPLPALLEVARVTRPEGWVFVSFPPFYAPWGAHLNNWITLPWAQVLFSERTLINAAMALEQTLQVNRRLMPEARLDLRGCQTLPHINKMTLGRFEAILRRTPLQLVRKAFHGLGWRRRPGYRRLVQPLTRLPGLREVFTSHAVYVLRK